MPVLFYGIPQRIIEPSLNTGITRFQNRNASANGLVDLIQPGSSNVDWVSGAIPNRPVFLKKAAKGKFFWFEQTTMSG